MWKESWEWNSNSSMSWQCFLGRLSPDTVYIDCARLSHFQTNDFTGRVLAHSTVVPEFKMHPGQVSMSKKNYE